MDISIIILFEFIILIEQKIQNKNKIIQFGKYYTISKIKYIHIIHIFIIGS